MFPYSHAEGSNYNQDKINCISIESKSLSQDYVHHETIENDYIYSVPQILHILKREWGQQPQHKCNKPFLPKSSSKLY